MTESILLAVIEVPFAERVRCAAEGCGHSVYRRVHLVRSNDVTQVYGSDCFSRLFGSTNLGKSAPRYTTAGSSRALTPEERQLLVENTERLIEKFELEHQTSIVEAQRKRELADQSRNSAKLLQSQPHYQLPIAKPTVWVPPTPPVVPTAAQRREAEVEAFRVLSERFPGVNLDAPGFKGLIRMEAEKILRRNESSG